MDASASPGDRAPVVLCHDGSVEATEALEFVADERNVPEALLHAAKYVERPIDVQGASYFVSRITVVPTDSPVMRRWRKRLFVAMARNRVDPSHYFRLPDDRTVTMGSLIEL